MCNRLSSGPSAHDQNCCLKVCKEVCKLHCKTPFNGTNYTTSQEVRKLWEEWDASILILYILFAQLFLHLFGTHRTKATKTRRVSSLTAWFMYLLCELLAVLALGKLSKVETDEGPMSPFRIMWAPTILFYLGGPDTLTVLTLEENSLWVKHVIALITLGFRTSYVLYVSWTTHLYSFLALLMLFPGMIKYGDRVWIMRSRARGNHEGFVRLNENQPQEDENVSTARPGTKAKEVLQAYSYFRTLNSRNPRDFKKENCSVKSIFKAIEIELGFLYDALFSKMGSIFTVWGCILRFLCLSLLVGVLVLVLVMKKKSKFLFKIDFPISIILIVGAIILEVAGILGQLVSDWAVVWASKYRFKMMKPIFILQDYFLFKRKRWSGLMGQCTLKNFRTKDQPTFIGWIYALCGENKMLQMKFSPYFEEVPAGLENLVFENLNGKSQNNPQDDQASTGNKPRGDQASTGNNSQGDQASTGNNSQGDQKSGRIEPKFYESIIIWHVLTEMFCAEVDTRKFFAENKPEYDKAMATIALTRYMMYLLVKCPMFPFCRRDDDFEKACGDAKKICIGNGSTPSKGELGESTKKVQQHEPGESPIKVQIEPGESQAQHEPGETPIKAQQEPGESPTKMQIEPGENQKKLQNVPSESPIIVQQIEEFKSELEQMNVEARWQRMSTTWVKMLCSAAASCTAEQHAKELLNGVEFISHVWLLLVHLGKANWLDNNASTNLGGAGGDIAQKTTENTVDFIDFKGFMAPSG